MNKVVSTSGTGSGTAMPAQGENEKADDIADKGKPKKDRLGKA